jgi:hypothetical protein
MQNSLYLHDTLLTQLRKWLPEERITRLRNLAWLMTGLFLARSVHLSHIARKLPLQGQVVSLTNRLRRFLDNPRVNVWHYYQPIARQLLTRFCGQRLTLLIDCTALGFHYQLMVIAIAYRRRALPLTWSVHRSKHGMVHAKAQVTLLRRLAPLISRKTQVWVVGDAGFGRAALMRWLSKRHWHYCLRVNSAYHYYRSGMGWAAVAAIPVTAGETLYLGWVRWTKLENFGWVQLVAHWEQGEDEPWFLVTDQPAGLWTIRLYKKRMWVEELFGDLKGHGFDLEATHLQDLGRLTGLALAAMIVYVWLIALGSHVIKRGLRYLVDRRDRRDKSLFRIGWDWIERCLALDNRIPLTFRPVCRKVIGG